MSSALVVRPGPGMVRRLSRNVGAGIGGVLLLALVTVATLAPVIAPRDPLKISPQYGLRPPGREFWFGTDQLGRDLFSRVVWGTRISLRLGIIAVLIAVGAGVPLGLAAGYYGGRLDLTVMRMIDLMLAFPGILLALVLALVVASAADQLDVFDQEGRRAGHATMDQGAGRLDLFDRDSRRTGYGIQRPDGSWDLFRPDGSRLGRIESGLSGLPSRLVVQPRKR